PLRNRGGAEAEGGCEARRRPARGRRGGLGEHRPARGPRQPLPARARRAQAPGRGPVRAGRGAPHRQCRGGGFPGPEGRLHRRPARVRVGHPVEQAERAAGREGGPAGSEGHGPRGGAAPGGPARRHVEEVPRGRHGGLPRRVGGVPGQDGGEEMRTRLAQGACPRRRPRYAGGPWPGNSWTVLRGRAAMPAKTAVRGPGAFQWDAGGWFGSQLGGTLWLLAGAAVLALPAPGVAAVWAACFAGANALGLWLWRRRDRLVPYPALQLLTLCCAACGLLTFVALDAFKPAGGPLGAADRGYAALLVFPALMALFHLRERAARARGAQAAPGGPD